MRATLDQWLMDLAERQDGVRAAADAQGHVVLECDERCIVNLVEGPAAGELCALARLGRVPVAGGDDEHAEPVYGDDWYSHGCELDGFHWSISCNLKSGVFAFTANAAMASLDSVAFDRWMCQVLERVRPLAALFAPHGEDAASLPSPQPSAGNGWLAAKRSSQ